MKELAGCVSICRAFLSLRVAYSVSALIILSFVSLPAALADTHWVCQSFSCVQVQGSGPNQCYTDSDCNTECSVNGVGTGNIYAGDKCGECTSGACAGKELGDECTVTIGMMSTGSIGAHSGTASITAMKKGKCGSSSSCSFGDPGNKNYAGACGMHCACDVAPDNLAQVCLGEPACEELIGS